MSPFVRLLLKKTKCVYLRGAGIVEGSQPIEEWLEIERKAAGLISLFAENNGE